MYYSFGLESQVKYILVMLIQTDNQNYWICKYVYSNQKHKKDFYYFQYNLLHFCVHIFLCHLKDLSYFVIVIVV